MDHPRWRPVRGGAPFHVEAGYLLLNDNLLDLSHVAYVHAGSIGTDNVADFPILTERGRGLRPHVADGGGFAAAAALRPDGRGSPAMSTAGRSRSRRCPPTTPSMPAARRPAPAVADAPGGAKVEFFNLNAMTPETATTTHYFYAHARSFALDDPAVDESFRVDFRRVFGEDISILAAQQANIDRRPGDGFSIDINVDGPGLAFRRMLAERIAAEEEAR